MMLLMEMNRNLVSSPTTPRVDTYNELRSIAEAGIAKVLLLE